MVFGLRPANERRRYKVTPSLIGWAQDYWAVSTDISSIKYFIICHSHTGQLTRTLKASDDREMFPPKNTISFAQHHHADQFTKHLATTLVAIIRSQSNAFADIFIFQLDLCHRAIIKSKRAISNSVNVCAFIKSLFVITAKRHWYFIGDIGMNGNNIKCCGA